MAETVDEDSGVDRSVPENGTSSTSPPYWDTDEDDDDNCLKPSALFGKSRWKIEKFSEINKREIRSSAFEAGGYNWYILMYPEGSDVNNHLSLFLCVANHEKLLPGWSHFAQFTISVVNIDSNKSKFSDTLHRFWKKEHDWGWKKFMELPKLREGFIDDSGSLTIDTQVQVIRERVDRPFRCLDCAYRRELVRVYLSNVEQICRRFVEERRTKLGRLIEDKPRWKRGLKTLEGQTKNTKARSSLLVAKESPAPIVSVDKDMFVLVDDLLLLLERAALEPLPPKDEKVPQYRTKDGNHGEEGNVERDERCLTELGRRTVEIYVLTHIFRPMHLYVNILKTAATKSRLHIKKLLR